MKVHVVAARPDMCLISDRHAGLLPRARNGKEMTARNGAQGLYRGKGPYRPWGGRQDPVALLGGATGPPFFSAGDFVANLKIKKITTRSCRPP